MSIIPSAIKNKKPMAIIWYVAAFASFSWSSPNVELVLKNDLIRLESSWSSLDSSLKRWILLVVIGVALEVVVVVAEWWHEWSDFKRGTVHTPERPKTWLFALGLLGAGLVATGVAGEFRIHSKIGKIETDMRNDTGLLVAIADERASAANKAADDTNERSKTLEREATELRKQNIANERTLVELKAKYAWRTISSAQAKILCGKLQTVRGRTLAVAWTANEPEQDVFGSQLADVLKTKECGLKVDRVTFGLFLSSGAHAPEPIALEDVSANNSDFADVVAAALVAASLAKAPIPKDPSGMTGQLTILIGPKRAN